MHHIHDNICSVRLCLYSSGRRRVLCVCVCVRHNNNKLKTLPHISTSRVIVRSLTCLLFRVQSNAAEHVKNHFTFQRTKVNARQKYLRRGKSILRHFITNNRVTTIASELFTASFLQYIFEHKFQELDFEKWLL